MRLEKVTLCSDPIGTSATSALHARVNSFRVARDKFPIRFASIVDLVKHGSGGR